LNLHWGNEQEMGLGRLFLAQFLGDRL